MFNPFNYRLFLDQDIIFFLMSNYNLHPVSCDFGRSAVAHLVKC